MRKIYSFIAIIGFIVMNLPLTAQVSQGGIPLSFSIKGTILNSNIPTQTMPFVDVQKLMAEDIANNGRKDIPWRFGENIPVNIDVKENGVLDVLSKGDKLWRIRIYSANALTINLAFSKYHFPTGAKLFIYNEAKEQVIGAFTKQNNQETGEFATTLVEGESVILEYFEPAKVEFPGELIIGRVTHGYRNVYDFVSKGLGSSGSCNKNVVCPEAVGWDNEARSACMLVTGGNGFCSGALINNTLNDGTPYVLTANHCYSNPSTWVFWFNWKSQTCTNPTTAPVYNSMSGAVLKAKYSNSDFCLVQMNSVPPANYNIYYSGWNKDNLTTFPDKVSCIHHPSGDIMKYSWCDGGVTTAGYNGAAGTDHLNIGSWSGGTTTEGGSSGSPLFDFSHRIIGQLHGGGAACGNTLSDYFGKFAVSWIGGGASTSRLSDWLDPANIGPLGIDGFDPNTPTANIDAQALQILNIETSYCGAATFIPTIVIKNRGTHNLISLSVQYDIDGLVTDSIHWTGNLSAGTIDTVYFPQITSTLGNHIFKAFVSAPNDSTDSNLNNDTLSFNFLATTGAILPFNEGFEGSFLPLGWMIDNPDGASTWESKSTSGIAGSTKSAYIDYFSYNAPGALDGLISPLINLFTSTNATLTFMVAYRRYDASSNDGLKIYVSKDCGLTYDTAIYSKAGLLLADTSLFAVNAYVPNSASQWRTETVDLSAYIGNAVKVKFEGICDYGNNLYIDQINIDQTSNISSRKKDFHCSVYPNPASKYITVSGNLPEISNIEIYDVLGKLMYQSIGNTATCNIGLEKFSNGIYYVKIFTQNKIFTEKIIVAK